MSAFNCKHSTEWPLETLYKWFVQQEGNAIADVSSATIGDESVVTVQATVSQYFKQITVEEVNSLLGKVSSCPGCIKDLFSQAKQFLNPSSEVRSTVGAFLYAATVYDRAQKVTEEGIELERIREVLDRALDEYQKSRKERCLHSVIKYCNVDMAKYLMSKDSNWSECNIEGCFPSQIIGNAREMQAPLESSSIYTSEIQRKHNIYSLINTKTSLRILLSMESGIKENEKRTNIVILRELTKKLDISLPEKDEEIKDDTLTNILIQLWVNHSHLSALIEFLENSFHYTAFSHVPHSISGITEKTRELERKIRSILAHKNVGEPVIRQWLELCLKGSRSQIDRFEFFKKSICKFF